MLCVRRFSDYLIEHPHQIERGSYAVSLVASHIAEGAFESAREVANQYSMGTRTAALDFSNQNSGKTFFELATEWLQNSKH